MISTLSRIALAVIAATVLAAAPAWSSVPPQRPLLPVAPDRSHPGAAVLAHDVRTVPRAAVKPSISRAQQDMPAYVADGCQVGGWHPRYCVYGDTTGPKKVVALVGDSVAGQWLPALNEIARKHHWKIVVALHGRCAWSATMQADGPVNPYRSCFEWGKRVLTKMLTRLRPDVVITSDRPTLGVPAHPAPSRGTFHAIGSGMAKYWHRLIAQHIGVIGIRESPEMHDFVPACLQNSGAICSTSRHAAVAANTPTVVAAGLVNKGARLIDLTKLLCTATCAPIVGNVVVYRDVHHLTRTYVLTLAPYLERALLRVPILVR